MVLSDVPSWAGAKSSELQEKGERMKTKDLIAALQKEDPTGEVECCVGNADIIGVASMQAYWDGKLQTLQYDEKRRIVGAKVTDRGTKIKIMYLSIEDYLYDRPDLPVEIDLHPDHDGEYAAKVERWRKEAVGE